jgi:hypothetical protein
VPVEEHTLARPETIYDVIAEIVREETRYLRHYFGKVINNFDDENKGRIKVIIDELGWNTPDLACLANPRQMHGISVPALGEWVEIYFMNGNSGNPVYIGIAMEIQGQLPTKYQFGKHVIFEMPRRQEGIVFDENMSKMTMDPSKLDINTKGDINIDSTVGDITFLQGTEKAVLGNKLITWLSNFINIFYNAHTHTGNLGVPTSVPIIPAIAPVESDFCSIRIKLK